MVKRRHGVAAKRISRNKKTYWRKGADVAAVEEFVESVRVDEIQGGNLTAKSDTDLFFVQKQPTQGKEVVRCLKKVELKCFRNLKSDSATKVLTRHVPSSKKLKKKREYQFNKFAEKVSRSAKISIPKENDPYDLWAGESKPTSTSLLDADQEDYYLRHTRKRLPNLPKSKSVVVTKLPKIEPPHPGQSYNPTFDDHQDLLKLAVVQENQKDKKEQKIERKFAITGEIATEASKTAELREGLDLLKKEETDEESGDEEENAEKKSFTVPPINSENRKLRKQRSKANVEKKKKLVKVDRKLKKMRLNDVYRLRSLKNEIKQQEERTMKKSEKKKELKEAKMFKPAVLGRHRYEAPELELNLSTEIAGSLRKLKPEGNVLEDRYKSLQRRNIVEPRIFFFGQKRKFAKKKYEKRDCREVTADYVPRH